MILIHKKCRNKVMLDLSKAVKVLTPSFSVGFNGIASGMVDFYQTASPNPGFYCTECSKEIVSVTEELAVQCTICREYVEISSAVTTEFAPCLCSKCDEGLSSGKSTNPRVLDFRKYLNIGSYQKKSLEATLKQKINLQ